MPRTCCATRAPDAGPGGRGRAHRRDVRGGLRLSGPVLVREGIQNPSLSRALDRAIQGFFGILATIIVGLGYLLPLAVLGAVVAGAVTLVRRRGRATS